MNDEGMGSSSADAELDFAGDSIASAVIVTSADGAGVIELVGEHDAASAAKVEVAIHEQAKARRNVVLSLERATFLDSAMLTVMFRGHRFLSNEGQRLLVHCPQTAAVSGMIRLISLAEHLEVMGESLEQAISSAAKS